MSVQSDEPPRGSGLDAVADIAARRGTTWRAVAGLFVPPTLEWVRRLRDGRLQTDLRGGVSWRGAQRGHFELDLVSLETYARMGQGRPEASEHETLAHEHERLVAEAGGDLTARAAQLCTSMAERCRDERIAWSASDPARGRALRASQAGLLREDGADAVSSAAGRMLAATPAAPYPALAGFCVQWFAVELGSEVADSLR